MKMQILLFIFVKNYQLKFKPTAYTLRHYDSYDIEALRNFNFEASDDEINTVFKCCKLV